MSHHAEPGNIFRRKDSTKMKEEIIEEEIYITSIDAEGNVTKIRVY